MNCKNKYYQKLIRSWDGSILSFPPVKDKLKISNLQAGIDIKILIELLFESRQ